MLSLTPVTVDTTESTPDLAADLMPSQTLEKRSETMPHRASHVPLMASSTEPMMPCTAPM